MMIGEFDYGSLFDFGTGEGGQESARFETSTYVVFVAFLVLMAIIVMNLLVRLIQCCSLKSCLNIISVR